MRCAGWPRGATMTDWLTPEQRAATPLRRGWQKHAAEADRRLAAMEAELEKFADEAEKDASEILALRAHAAEADRRLAERDDVIRELVDALRHAGCTPDATHPFCAGCRTLARVDALGGER